MAQFAKEIAIFLEKIGLTTVLIPFLLTFVIIFAVLQKTKILGKYKGKKPKTKINAVVAFVLGFMVVAYADTVAVINRIAQYGVVLLIAGLVCVIIFAFTGFPKIGKSKIAKVIGLLAFIGFAFYVLGVFDVIDLSHVETKIFVPIIAILSFVLMVYFIIKPSKEKAGVGAPAPQPTPQTPSPRQPEPQMPPREKIPKEEIKRLQNSPREQKIKMAEQLLTSEGVPPENIAAASDEAKLEYFEDYIQRRQ